MAKLHEYADLRFKVSEWEDGTPFLSPVETGASRNRLLNDKFLLAIHLKDGTTLEQAEEIVRHLNSYIAKIGITILE